MTQPAASLSYTLYVGIDIAAETASVAWRTSTGPLTRAITIGQTESGYASLISQLGNTAVAAAQTLVVVEATGSYWISLALRLHEAGYRVSVINPAQAHHYAKAHLQRGKTDALDAQMLADLAARLQPAPWTPPPAVYTELQQRLAQRDDLVGIRTQVRNQRHALRQLPHVVEAVQQRHTELLQILDRQIEALEAELTDLLKSDDEWAAAARRLMTIKGVGLITASWLIVATLNFSLCDSASQATAYAGLAPYPRQSGKSLNAPAKIGHSGHGRLRTALYMATISGVTTNPVLKTFYERLVAAGKLKKVARIAVARKLLHIAWAVVTKHRSFDPNYSQRPRADTARV